MHFNASVHPQVMKHRKQFPPRGHWRARPVHVNDVAEPFYRAEVPVETARRLVTEEEVPVYIERVTNNRRHRKQMTLAVERWLFADGTVKGKIEGNAANIPEGLEKVIIVSPGLYGVKYAAARSEEPTCFIVGRNIH